MTIYTDGVHLISDTSVEELHEFATRKLKFKREWFQEGKPVWCPHYDLTTSRAKQRAIAAGAKLLPLKEFLEVLHQTEPYKEWQETRKKK